MMKKYKHSKKNTEQVGFYVALSVCIMAVGLAVWSAYSTFTEYPDETDRQYFSSLRAATTAQAAQEMTGVTEHETEATLSPTQPTETTEAETAAESKSISIYETSTLPKTEDAVEESPSDALSAVLKVTDNLCYPVKSRNIQKPYSEEAVYSKTMKDYRAHTGVDFKAAEGENVYAMCDGTVDDISVSELYGVIAVVKSEGFSVYYCGLGSPLQVEKGDTVKAGDTIGTVSQIPCESADGTHLHIEVRVGKKLIDPLSVINNND